MHAMPFRQGVGDPDGRANACSMQRDGATGEPVRESMDDAGRNVTGTAARSGCGRGTPSRLLNGWAGVSANMALALERIGWAADSRRCAGLPGRRAPASPL